MRVSLILTIFCFLLVSCSSTNSRDKSREVASIVGLTPTEKPLRLMRMEYLNQIERPWFPTVLPGKRSKGSDFSQWARIPGNSITSFPSDKSASCFEVLLLYAVNSGVIGHNWVQNRLKFIDQQINKRRFGKVPRWVRAWLKVLSGNKDQRFHYVRAKRIWSQKEIEEWGYTEAPPMEEGERVFPQAGDIIFFNPINRKKNRHFDHVAMATGRKITRRQLTGNPEDNDDNSPEHLEAEIYSFYGRGKNKDTLVERTTIEHMLDTHSMIKRSAMEGGDRQVFFARPPWAKR